VGNIHGYSAFAIHRVCALRSDPSVPGLIQKREGIVQTFTPFIEW